MIKVRIDKAEPHQWYYKEFIGENLNVKEHENNSFYRFTDKKTILKSDCTVILDDTEQVEKEFVLPEKWCVSHCKESLAWIQKKAEIGGKHISKSNWYMFPNNNFKSNFSDVFPEGYTEITKDQFFAHVWEKEFKKEEPIFGGKNGLLDHFKVEPVIIAKSGEWVNIVGWGGVSGNTTHGFELNKPYCLAKDLIPENGFLVESANSFTGLNGWDSAFSLNMVFERCEAPVPAGKETDYYPGLKYQKLFNHMKNEHELTLLQSEIDEIILIVNEMETKAEIAAQETTEPIPFDLYKYNTGKYNVVTRSNDNVKIISTTEELDQPIIGIHDKTVEKWSIDGNYYIRSKENDLDLLLVAKIETEDNYVSSVEEEHEEKINNTEVACATAGFNLKRKDLDMFVSMYDLVCEYGGKLDLDTITDAKFKVNSRHDSTV